MYGFAKFAKKPLSKKYNYQSQMEICKVYEDDLKSDCIDYEFKQQLKQDVLDKFELVLKVLKNDVVIVSANKNIKQSYNLKIS